jgi:hypothetical protein
MVAGIDGQNCGCKNFEPIKPAPEYEWVDDTDNWIIVFNGIRVYAKNKEHGWIMYVAPRDLCGMGTLCGGYRMVDNIQEATFRIERRVKKPASPVFEICDKVRYSDKEYTIPERCLLRLLLRA